MGTKVEKKWSKKECQQIADKIIEMDLPQLILNLQKEALEKTTLEERREKTKLIRIRVIATIFVIFLVILGMIFY